MTEKQFSSAVLDLARVSGWMIYHTHDARRSAPGFPDLTLCRPPHLVFAELKTERGRLAAAQSAWLVAFRSCGLDAHVWRPADWDEIVEALR